jgi:hypothetical protein
LAEDAPLKRIELSDHALDRLRNRGGTLPEVELTIRAGEPVPARQGRLGYRKNFVFENVWKGRYYSTRQIMVIVAEEPECLVVVTTYVFFFGEEIR